MRADLHERFLKVVKETDAKIKAGKLPDPRPVVNSRYHLRDVGKAGELNHNTPDDNGRTDTRA